MGGAWADVGELVECDSSAGSGVSYADFAELDVAGSGLASAESLCLGDEADYSLCLG